MPTTLPSKPATLETSPSTQSALQITPLPESSQVGLGRAFWEQRGLRRINAINPESVGRNQTYLGQAANLGLNYLGNLAEITFADQQLGNREMEQALTECLHAYCTNGDMFEVNKKGDGLVEKMTGKPVDEGLLTDMLRVAMGKNRGANIDVVPLSTIMARPHPVDDMLNDALGKTHNEGSLATVGGRAMLTAIRFEAMRRSNYYQEADTLFEKLKEQNEDFAMQVASFSSILERHLDQVPKGKK